MRNGEKMGRWMKAVCGKRAKSHPHSNTARTFLVGKLSLRNSSVSSLARKQLAIKHMFSLSSLVDQDVSVWGTVSVQWAELRHHSPLALGTSRLCQANPPRSLRPSDGITLRHELGSVPVITCANVNTFHVDYPTFYSIKSLWKL